MKNTLLMSTIAAALLTLNACDAGVMPDSGAQTEELGVFEPDVSMVAGGATDEPTDDDPESGDEAETPVGQAG